MLFFFSITGLTWSKWSGANIAQLRHLLNSDTPTLHLALNPKKMNVINPHAEHYMQMDMSGQHLSTKLNFKDFDRIVELAHQNGLNAQALQIKPSYQKDRAWSIEEMNHRWPIQIDALAVDMSTQHIIDHLRFSDFPLSAKLTRWGVDLHIGVLFGWLNQVLLVLSAAIILLVLIWQQWKNCNQFQKIIYISILFGLYFLLPVWTISVVLLQLTAIVFHYLILKKIP